MPNIPGLTSSVGTIPRLGQGVRGGRGAVAGLPGGPGISAIPGLPAMSAIPRISVPSVAPPAIPTPAVTGPRTVAMDSASLDHSKSRIDAAMQILHRVSMGVLEPKKAAKLLDELAPDEKRVLTKAVLENHARNGGPSPQSELMALRYLPMGKDPGAMALHDPARHSGIGANLASDAMNAVIGMPAGLALAGKAAVEDIKDYPGNLIHGRPVGQHLVKDIAEPIGRSYAKTYGSALHGDFGPMEQHPLGPVLDATALLSAGLGTAGRIGEASTALRARRVSELTPMFHGAEKTAGGLTTKYGRLDDVMGPGLYVSDAKPVADYYADIAGGKTHAMGFPSKGLIDADTPISQLPAKVRRDLKPVIDSMPAGRDTVSQVIGELAAAEDAQGMAKFHSVMTKHGYSGTHYPAFTDREDIAGAAALGAGPDAYADASRAVDTSREAVIWDQKGLESALKNPKNAIAKVGDQYTIHEHAPKMRPIPGKDSGTLPDGTPFSRSMPGIDEWKTLKKDLSPDLIKAEPWRAYFPVIRMPDGEIKVGAPGFAHEDAVMPEDFERYGINPYTEGSWKKLEALGFEEGTGVLDPETGKVLHVNTGQEFAYNPEGGGQGRFVGRGTDLRVGAGNSELEAKMTEAARHVFGEKSETLPQRYSVRQQGKIVASNFPDKDSAVKHAQSLISPYKSPLAAFVKGGGDRGRLIDRYEKARGFNHEAEVQNLMGEVADVLDKKNLRFDRRSLPQVAREVWNDIRQTSIEDRNRPAQIAAGNAPFLHSKPISAGAATMEIALREASDLVRAGAIYMRPAYLPNNWVGNAFMNMAHQGVLAPANLAKALVVDKYIGKHYTAAMDKVMGQNAAEVVTSPKGRGYIGSVTNPLAHSMGMVADQPFRRAAFLHEARRAGYSKLSEVQKLFDRAAGGDQKSLREIATVGRKAQEEIVKFGHMNDAERSVIRNLVFVYSWIRGASRYAARFPLQHPIQSLAYSHLSQDVGQPWLNKEMGGVPYYLAGAIPVGRDKHNNPILINPFSLNPLGTAVDVGRAVAGTAKVLRHPKSFNKYVDQDVASLTNPLIQSYLQAREGGKPMKAQLEQTIAPLRLAHDLQHPGSGSVFPTSRTEALGHFTVGSMFPRVADQQALTRSLEREQRNDPIARIPTDLAAYKKMTGEDMPSDLIGAYRGDLDQVKMMKDFQTKYASDHGQSGFRNLPPQNKVEAAIKFLAQHKLASPADLRDYRLAANELKTDADLNSFSNTLFASTGIGQYKQAWDTLMRQARGLRLTRKRG